MNTCKMRFAHCFFGLALAFLCACTTQPATKVADVSKSTLSDMIDRIRPSVVRVQAVFPSGAISTGTGFFVNRNGDVVTANHVIHPAGITEDPSKIIIFVRVPTIRSRYPAVILLASFSGYGANVKATDVAHDIAIIGSDGGANPFTVPPIGYQGQLSPGQEKIGPLVDVSALADSLPKDGRAIFISGFPLDFPTLITNFGYIASSDPIEFDETPQGAKVRNVLWADIHANHGNSGGPAFSADTGEVVGMQVAVKLAPIEFYDGTQGPAYGVQQIDPKHQTLRAIAYNAGIAIIIPTEYISALLRSHNIPFNNK